MRYSPLKAQRKLQGLSQEQVAEALGVSPRTVRRWEQGMAVPQPYYHKQLQALFGKTVEELGLASDLYEDDEESPVPEPDAPTQSSSPEDPSVWETVGSINNSRKRYALRIRMSLSLPGIISRSSGTERQGGIRRQRSLIGQIGHGIKKFSGWISLLLIIAALIIYALPWLIARSDTGLYPAEKGKQVVVTQPPNVPIAQPASPTLILTPTQPVSYEAEASENSLAGGTAVVECPSCSGGKKVGYIGGGSTLQFNNISKNIAGTYVLTFYYVVSRGDTLTMYIRVNNSEPDAYFNVPDTSNPNAVGAVDISVSLQAGQNSIEFFNPSAYAPDIDRIVI